jgi:hypothetical protein
VSEYPRTIFYELISSKPTEQNFKSNQKSKNWKQKIEKGIKKEKKE